MNALNRIEGQQPVEFKGVSAPMDTGRIDKLKKDHQDYLKRVGVPQNQADRPRDPTSLLKTEIAKIEVQIDRISKEIHEMKQLGSEQSTIDGRAALLETYRRMQDIKDQELVDLTAQQKLEQQFFPQDKKAA